MDFVLSWVCTVIDHRRHQNVATTEVTHSLAVPYVLLLCFYYILRSSDQTNNTLNLSLNSLRVWL